MSETRADELRRRRPSAGRALLRGLAVGLVAAGSALAGDGRSESRLPGGGGQTEVEDGWYLGGNEWYSDPSSDSSGGVVYLGAPSGDLEDAGSQMGVSFDELYDGVYVVGPTNRAGMGVFDQVFVVQWLDGYDPTGGAEPDYLLRNPEDSQSNGLILPSTYGRTQFERQSAFGVIHTKSAQQIATGVGVKVAVLDTGVDATHPQLAGHVLAGYDFIDGDGDASEGIPDGVDQDLDGKADDGYGHGTAVAGLVLAAAPDARIMPVRVLDVEGTGTVSSVSAGILWAVDHKADVINLSLGMNRPSEAISRALDQAAAAGIVVVAAAGKSRDPFAVDFPASRLDVIAVRGTPSSRIVNELAKLATPLMANAPATRVVGPYPQNRWYRGTGTSFAAALVSGGAALARQMRPGSSAEEVDALLAPSFRLDLTRLVR